MLSSCLMFVLFGVAFAFYPSQIVGFFRPSDRNEGIARFPKAVLRTIGILCIIIGVFPLIGDVADGEEVGAASGSADEQFDAYLLCFGLGWIAIGAAGLIRRQAVALRVVRGLNLKEVRAAVLVFCVVAIVGGLMLMIQAF